MKKTVLVLSCLVMFLSLASAEILFEQPHPIYSGGDELILNITLLPSVGTTDFFDVSLRCGEDSIDLYRNPLTLRAGERAVVPFSVMLDPHFIGSLNGTCALDASYGSQSGSSSEFLVVKELLLELSLDGNVYDPGKSVSISGNAKKRTGKALNGFVTLALPGIVSEITTSTTNGSFRFNVSLPSNTPSGTYSVIVHAYEKNNAGDIVNEGVATSYIVISQVVTRIAAALSTSDLTPGQELQYTVILSDQTGAPVQKELDIVVIQPNQTAFTQGKIMSGELQHLGISSSSLNGSWRVEARYGGMNTQQPFTVAAVANASFTTLSDGTLLVRNIGNIPYRKTAEITIGEVKKVIPIVLEKIGESKLFKIQAPDGTYGIKVNDGENSYALGSTFLTGGAISVREVRNSATGPLAWALWGLVIITILIVVAVSLGRVKRKSFASHTPSHTSSRSSLGNSLAALREESPRSEPYTPKHHTSTLAHTSQSRPSVPMSTFTKQTTISAPSSTTRHSGVMPGLSTGEKQETLILAVNIKNRGAVERHPEAAMVLNRALESGQSGGTHNVRDGMYDLFYFPTRGDYRADILRVIGITQRMEQIIAQYNRTHVLKIEYCFGIHRGPVIIESQGSIKKFTALGNSVLVAKAATQRATNAIVLSEMVRRTGVGALKGEPLPGGTYWKVLSIINREDHSAFLRGFKKRLNQ